MASMVAKACSSSSQLSPSMTVQEKGSRNKRKFRADPPLADPHKITPLPQNERTNYEFTAEKFEIVPSYGPSNGCGMCSVKQDASEALKLDLGLSCPVGPSDAGPPSRFREETEANEVFHNADWNDLTESDLEDLVLSNLDTVFKSAIKKIVAFGYTEEIALKAVLRSGLCYGCKDTMSNIVDNTLAFLRSGQDMDSMREPYFEDLQQMEKYILAELVCVLKEVRPFFSTGDAMWCLLICDMNVSHACAMETEPPSYLVSDGSANGTSSTSVPTLPRTEAKTVESNFLRPIKPNPSASNIQSETTNTSSIPFGHSFQSEAPAVVGIPNLKSKTSLVSKGVATDKEGSNSTPDTVENFFSLAGTSHLPVSEEKFVGSRKVSGITKREYILRQKSLHLEKHFRTYGSKGASRVGKFSSFGGLVLDKKLKSIADSTSVNARNGFKLGKAIGIELPQDNPNNNISTNIGFSSVPAFNVNLEPDSAVSLSPKSNIQSSSPVVNTLPVLPTADTELSLSLPAKSGSGPTPVSCNSEASSFSSSQWVPQDKKDEMLLKLVPRARELQNQLQEWTEWANQKVMQAARRLGKDKAELKALRQEKEEVDRLKKEKQNLEENTMKKLSEMENALCKASGQVERANSAVCRLEVENTALRKEMEAAKLRASESAASCQEMSRREKKAVFKCQSWEKQKSIFMEELAAEKLNFAELQQKVEQAVDLQSQLEGKCALECKAKEEVLTQASSLKKEKEKIEVSAKSKEDMMKLKAESNLQEYKDDIQKLEKEISLLRLKTDSSKIAALKRGIEGSYASKLTDNRSTPAQRESRVQYISRMATGFEDCSENGGLKRERECVMCLSEEMSVIFLPCAHQVVCLTCNELHEKQGMKDCPSCRSSIQQRISVRYASL